MRSLCLSAALFALAAPLRGQTFELTPLEPTAHVGDPVAFRATVRLGAGMELIDRAPRPPEDLSEAIRFIGADSLQGKRDGALTGLVHLAFYRTGLQPAPTLSLLIRHVDTERAETLVHRPVSITIASLLPPGNPRLKDLKDLIYGGGWPILRLAIVGALIGTVILLLRRRGARGGSRTAEVLRPVAAPSSSYQEAVAALDAIERDGLDGGVDRHYEAVVSVLRQYLKAVDRWENASLTSTELLVALPGALSPDGQRSRLGRLLCQADEVKFARARPGEVEARQHLRDARGLLAEWNALRGEQPRLERADALR
jgi:hypothetical protein